MNDGVSGGVKIFKSVEEKKMKSSVDVVDLEKKMEWAICVVTIWREYLLSNLLLIN